MSDKESLEVKKGADILFFMMIERRKSQMEMRLLLDKQKTQDDVAAMIVEAVQKVVTFLRNYMSNNILHVHQTQAAGSSARDLQYQLYLMMKNGEKLGNDDLSIWWLLKIKFETPASSVAPYRTHVIRTRDHEDHHDDDARPEGESGAKSQKASNYGTYSIGESSSEQAMDQEPDPLHSVHEIILRVKVIGNETNQYLYDFGTDDDKVPIQEVSPELMEEIPREIDEA
ncbi:hypothetical protein Tco_0115147 [Tanacetum coccineum]